MALLFDADTEKVDWGDITWFDGASAITIAFWAYFDDVSDQSPSRHLVGKWNDTGSEHGFIVSHHDGDGDTLIVGVRAASGFYDLDRAVAVLATGAWNHWVWTWTSGNPGVNTVYKDGVSQSLTSHLHNGATDTIANRTASFTVGRRADNVSPGPRARIDGVSGWTVALSSGEVVALASGVHPMRIRPSSLVHCANSQFTADLMRAATSTVTGATVTDSSPMTAPFAGAFGWFGIKTTAAAAGGAVRRRFRTLLGVGQ